MENVRETGVYLNAAEIKAIVEGKLEWAEVVEGQVFCAKDIMSEGTPIGTAIMIGVDGIKAEEGKDELRLILSSGIYEIPVKTEGVNEELNIRFDRSVPLSGTYGQMVGDELDILTEEEKAFKKAVDELLGERADEYAELFRRDNTREIGSRGLLLLEKVKAEIKNDDILTDNDVTPFQLVSTFIEVTDKYVEANNTVEKLNHRHEDLLNTYKETFEEGSKRTKKIARDIEVVNRKIDTNRHLLNYCMATINAAVLPVLNMRICR